MKFLKTRYISIYLLTIFIVIFTYTLFFPRLNKRQWYPVFMVKIGSNSFLTYGWEQEFVTSKETPPNITRSVYYEYLVMEENGETYKYFVSFSDTSPRNVDLRRSIKNRSGFILRADNQFHSCLDVKNKLFLNSYGKSFMGMHSPTEQEDSVRPSDDNTGGDSLMKPPEWAVGSSEFVAKMIEN